MLLNDRGELKSTISVGKVFLALINVDQRWFF